MCGPIGAVTCPQNENIMSLISNIVGLPNVAVLNYKYIMNKVTETAIGYFSY